MNFDNFNGNFAFPKISENFLEFFQKIWQEILKINKNAFITGPGAKAPKMEKLSKIEKINGNLQYFENFHKFLEKFSHS